MASRGKAQTHLVPMVTKIAKVLETFQVKGPRLSFTEIVESCKIPKASAFRILESLRVLGYLSKTEQGPYRLTYKLLEVASIVQRRDPVRRLALPYLEELRKQTGETANLGILENAHVVYVEVLESQHRLRMVPTIGSKAPLHATSLGKAIIAWLPEDELSRILRTRELRRFTERTKTTEVEIRRALTEVRKLGYAVDDEEETSGCVCIGAPVFEAKGRVSCAVSISAPSTRMNPKRVAELGGNVKRACLALSSRLGFPGEP